MDVACMTLDNHLLAMINLKAIDRLSLLEEKLELPKENIKEASLGDHFCVFKAKNLQTSHKLIPCSAEIQVPSPPLQGAFPRKARNR